MRISTIGGNVAENSGGLRGLKYGVTRDYVMALEVVLPDGRIARFGSACVKDVAGYSMKDLFIGSEGHARDHHRGAAEAGAAAGGAADDAGALRSDRGRGRDRVGDHRGAHHSVHARVSRSDDGSLRRGVRPRRPADRLRRGAADGNRRPSGGGRRRSGAHDGASRASTAPAKCGPRATRPKRWRWRRRDGTPSPRWRGAGRRRSSRTSPCRAASWRRW